MDEHPVDAVAWRDAVQDALRQRDDRIKAMRAQGMTLRAIARELQLSHVGVHDILHRASK